MRRRALFMAAAVLIVWSTGSATTTRAQAGGCTPGAIEGDLAETVTGLTRTVQTPDEARGTMDSIADAVRQNNIRVVCLNDPTSDNPVIDTLIQGQLQALDALSSVLASNPDLRSFLARNNIDIDRVAIVGTDTSSRPIRIYVWNRR
jgi:hypothetical protein